MPTGVNLTAYYNEFDPKAAAWLRELIADGLVAHGDVDERSIVDVAASDLEGYSQHHFFAGIGGWSYALRLAGWPDDLPVWTASLPCQPFSAAGKGLGKQDERHLLPHFIGLVAQCRPTVLFGEQVSAAIKHGWLDDLYTEMEANHYTVGSVVIGAHSIGAAHIRQRLYWVADSSSKGREEQPGERRILSKAYGNEPRKNIAGGSRMGDTESSDQQRDGQREACDGSQESIGGSSVSWIYCRDNKYRPIESGLKPLVNGVPRGMLHSSDPFNTQEARTVRLKGYGNAIVPTLAAEFIKAYMQCKS